MRNIVIGVFAVALCGSQAIANLVVNGDFSLSVPSNGAGNGWASTDVDGAGGWRSAGGNPDGTFILNSGGSVGSNPTLSQDITGLIVGQQYEISGDVAMGNVGSTSNSDFGVQIDGLLWEYRVPPSATTWDHFSQTFIASSTSATLVLTGERHTDYDPRVDNISVVMVPEPGSIVFLSLGGMSLICRRQRGR